MNKINDAVKAAEKKLPNDLTWAQAFDLIGEKAVRPIWCVSGRVAADDRLSSADRHRLADAIVTSTKETVMTSSTSDDAAAAMFADADQRQYLLAAAQNRSRLQLSDTENLFDIATRLREQVTAARAADAARRRPAEATIFDASGHRPGWRDARRKNRQAWGA
jgi:hypothetical protein